MHKIVVVHNPGGNSFVYFDIFDTTSSNRIFLKSGPRHRNLDWNF